MRYYLCSVLVEIPEKLVKSWDARCDETSEIVSRTHNPQHRCYLTCYTKIGLSRSSAARLKTILVTQEGGI